MKIVRKLNAAILIPIEINAEKDIIYRISIYESISKNSILPLLITDNKFE